MKEQQNNKKRSALLSVIGLVLLLLLSPCKVRNYIQAELGIPTTEVASKNQTTVSNTTCSAFELSEAVVISSKVVIQSVVASEVKEITSTLPSSEGTSVSNDFYGKRTHSRSPIPYYILYQNFKVYLS